MSFNVTTSKARAGDIAQLVGLRHKNFIITLKEGARLETHRGILQHDDLIGKPWGAQVFSHIGSPFFLLQPSLADLLNDLPRSTQILYPKDIGFILITMGIGPGKKVIEAGTGSGSMTIALAYNVSVDGHVISYEVRPDTQNLAKKNSSASVSLHASTSNCATSPRVWMKRTQMRSSSMCRIHSIIFHRFAPRSSPADSFAVCSRPSIKWNYCSLPCGEDNLPLSKYAKCWFDITNRNRRAFAPRTAWWHIPAF